MKQNKKQQIEDQEAREIWKELPEHKKEKMFELLSEFPDNEFAEHIRNSILDE